MAEKRKTESDFSSFMCVILMLTGCLVTIMISNVVILSANPENVQITAVMPQGVDPEKEKELVDVHGNVIKIPWYVEVWRDRLIIHPGEIAVPVRELERRDNNFDLFLRRVEDRKNSQYIVLLVREHGAVIARKLKKVIRDRGIDTGMDLLFSTNAIVLRNVNTNQTSDILAPAG
jgi:hypothetical protein